MRRRIATAVFAIRNKDRAARGATIREKIGRRRRAPALGGRWRRQDRSVPGGL